MFRFGFPHRLHFDQGSEFDSELVRDVYKLLSIHKTRTTAYHPQSDGQVERANRTVRSMLTALVNEARDDWDNHSPYILFAYRASVHSTTKCTPNLLMLNHETNLPINLMDPLPEEGPACKVRYVEWIKEASRYAFEFARKSILSSTDHHERLYNLNSCPAPFKLGDNVWWYYPPKAQSKFGRKWFGPYLVVQVIDDVRIKIQRHRYGRPRVGHCDLLKQYEGRNPLQSWVNPVDQAEPPPSPVNDLSTNSDQDSSFPVNLELDPTLTDVVVPSIDPGEDKTKEAEGGPPVFAPNKEGVTRPTRRGSRVKFRTKDPDFEYY